MRWTVGVLCFGLMLSTNALAGPGEFRGGLMEAPLPPEREEEILEQLKLEAPEKYEKLMWVKEEFPEVYPRALRRLSRMDERRTPERKERHEELEKIRDQIHTLAAGYGTLPAKEQPARKKEIAALVEKAFDLRQKELEGRISDVEGRLAAQKAKLAERSGSRAKLVEERVQRILSGDDRPER